MTYFICLLIFLVGACVGAVAAVKLCYRSPKGTIKIVADDTDGSKYLFLELEESVDILEKRDEVVFRIARK